MNHKSLSAANRHLKLTEVLAAAAASSWTWDKVGRDVWLLRRVTYSVA